MATEKRLIDANALMEQLVKKKSGPATVRYTEGFNDALMRFRSMVHSAPTVDAVKVVHGRWEDNGIPESMLSKCSVCGFSCGAYSFNYCPNCGAKMDGGSHETD